MPDDAQVDEIHVEEVILRRIPEAQMDFGSPRMPLPDGFAPHSTNDTDGLSVYREKHHSPADIAGFRTRGTKPMWVVKIPVQKMNDLGLTLRPDPLKATASLPAQPGHALIVDMNSKNRKSDQVENWKRQLVEAAVEVVGPFEPPANSD